MRADSLRADDPIPRSRDNYPPRGSRDLSFPSLARRRHCWRGGVGGGMVRKSESRISVKWQGGLGSIIPARPVPWDGLPRRIGTEAMHGKRGAETTKQERRSPWDRPGTSTGCVNRPMVAQKTGPTEKAAASRIPKIFGTPLIPRQADGDPTPRSLHGLRLQRRQQEVETCCAQEATGNKTFEACPIFWIVGHEPPTFSLSTAASPCDRINKTCVVAKQ
jgi:hypothetical protein